MSDSHKSAGPSSAYQGFWPSHYMILGSSIMLNLRISILLIGLGMCVFGCAGPVVNEVTLDFPATVLRVVGTPPVTDGRARFREIFCQVLAEEPEYQEPIGNCDHFLHRLNDEPLSRDTPQPLPTPKARYRVLIVPGFLNECFSGISLPFENAMITLKDPRFKFEKLVVSGRSSSDANAVSLYNMIESLDLESDEKIVLLGHSKGASDILHFLTLYPKAAQRVSAVVSIAGAINGSRLADKAEKIFGHPIRNLLLNYCEPGDDKAINNLQTAESMSWLANNPLPDSVHYFSIAAFTQRENINVILKSGYDLLSIYDPRNDGLLLISDQIIPGGEVLGYVNADHLSVVLELENKNFLISSTIQSPWIFPRKTLLQSVLLYVAETLESNQETAQIGN